MLSPSLSLPLSPELEEFLQALKCVQHSLTDTQSQLDVELVLQLLAKEDFKNAYNIYNAVSQNMNRSNTSSPLTVQAQDLCQEVHTVVILQLLFSFFLHLLKLDTNITWEQCEFAAVRSYRSNPAVSIASVVSFFCWIF